MCFVKISHAQLCNWTGQMERDLKRDSLICNPNHLLMVGGLINLSQNGRKVRSYFIASETEAPADELR